MKMSFLLTLLFHLLCEVELLHIISKFLPESYSLYLNTKAWLGAGNVFVCVCVYERDRDPDPNWQENSHSEFLGLGIAVNLPEGKFEEDAASLHF